MFELEVEYSFRMIYFWSEGPCKIILYKSKIFGLEAFENYYLECPNYYLGVLIISTKIQDSLYRGN